MTTFALFLIIYGYFLWSMDSRYKSRLYNVVRDENDQQEFSRCVESIRVDCSRRESNYIEALRDGLPTLMRLLFGGSEKYWERKCKSDSYLLKMGKRLGFI
jgi:hypothetical protein